MRISEASMPVIETGVVDIAAQLADDRLFLFTNRDDHEVVKCESVSPQKATAVFWAGRYTSYREHLLKFLRGEETAEELLQVLKSNPGIPATLRFRFTLEKYDGKIYQCKVQFSHVMAYRGEAVVSCTAVIFEPEWYVENDTHEYTGINLITFLKELPKFFERLDPVPSKILDDEIAEED